MYGTGTSIDSRDFEVVREWQKGYECQKFDSSSALPMKIKEYLSDGVFEGEAWEICAGTDIIGLGDPFSSITTMKTRGYTEKTNLL